MFSGVFQSYISWTVHSNARNITKYSHEWSGRRATCGPRIAGNLVDSGLQPPRKDFGPYNAQTIYFSYHLLISALFLLYK